MKFVTVFAGVLLCAATAMAQLVAPNQVGVRMGHVHLAVRDVTRDVGRASHALLPRG
jgi:hypothetical protein